MWLVLSQKRIKVKCWIQLCMIYNGGVTHQKCQSLSIRRKVPIYGNIKAFRQNINTSLQGFNVVTIDYLSWQWSKFCKGSKNSWGNNLLWMLSTSCLFRLFSIRSAQPPPPSPKYNFFVMNRESPPPYCLIYEQLLINTTRRNKMSFSKNLPRVGFGCEGSLFRGLPPPAIRFPTSKGESSIFYIVSSCTKFYFKETHFFS